MKQTRVRKLLKAEREVMELKKDVKCLHEQTSDLRWELARVVESNKEMVMQVSSLHKKAKEIHEKHHMVTRVWSGRWHAMKKASNELFHDWWLLREWYTPVNFPKEIVSDRLRWALF